MMQTSTKPNYIGSTARAALYAYLYVLLEWLFFVTKPSFMGAWPVSERVNALLIGALPFAVVAIAAHLALALAAFVVSRLFPSSRVARVLLKVVPAIIAAAIVLMLVDNFTYTMFGWGIVKAGIYTIPLYWLLCLAVFVLHLRRRPSRFTFKAAFAGAVIVVSGVTLLWSFHTADNFANHDWHSGWTGARLPNIIMFASDGVTADRMSAYGYRRKTTPNLDKYLDRALVADNAFTNSGWTTGSLTSMMTGKYPETTKVLYPPYTLKGRDAYQNLPRILRKLGYTNLQETVRYYADGPDLNWAGSFDYANGRKVDWPQVNQLSLALQEPRLFRDRVYQRLADRLGQLLFIKRMVDSYAAVTSGEADIAKVQGIPDETRMAAVFDFIRHAKRPFFIHIHLLGTHCCEFHPEHKYFSARNYTDKAQADAAVFDDTILQSDRYFGQMMTLLKKQHLLDNTLVVYTSDHNKGWDFRSQVPLIFMFPGGAHRGHIDATTQLLDVAPTILDYLDVPVPDWMEGKSLLQGGLKTYRPVFSVYRLDRKHFSTDKGDRLSRITGMGPPTWGLDKVGMVVCQRWYIMRLEDGKVWSGPIDTYRDKCPSGGLPSRDDARTMMSRFLHQRGFIF